mgnify:CR=1 FL=1
MRMVWWALLSIGAFLVVAGGGLALWVMVNGDDAAEAAVAPAPGAAAPRPAAAAAAAPVAEIPLMPTPQLAPAEIVLLEAEGDRQQAAGQYNDALRTYTRELEGVSGSQEHRLRVTLKLARIYEQYHCLAKAEELYLRALQDDPNNVEALYSTAAAHDKPGSTDITEVRLALDRYRAVAQRDLSYRDAGARITALESRLAELLAIKAANDRDHEAPTAIDSLTR